MILFTSLNATFKHNRQGPVTGIYILISPPPLTPDTDPVTAYRAGYAQMRKRMDPTATHLPPGQMKSLQGSAEWRNVLRLPS